MSEPASVTITSANLVAVTNAFKAIEDAYYTRQRLRRILQTDRKYDNWQRSMNEGFQKEMPDVPDTLPIDERVAVADCRIAKKTTLIAEQAERLQTAYGIVFVDDASGRTAPPPAS